jgi:hypothetical protein
MTKTISKSSSLHCLPRFATPRRPERRNRGREIAAIAKQLGQPLMPWQQLVADVASELDEATGLPAFREVVVTVPRQSGKTTLVLAYELHRALMWGRAQRIAYTAQTGFDARRKLIDDQAPILLGSPLSAAVEKVQKAQGNEAIVFRNGSRIDVLASSESAGHGRTLDLPILDEVFADADDRREQALLPAMSTRPDAQLFVVSTMGTEASTYLNRKVETGRSAVVEGLASGIAYFEWSAEVDADIDDPDTWRSCMPALGHTITLATVEHARRTMSEGDFRRSMLNQKTISDERVIPVGVWGEVCSEGVAPSGRLVFALDVNPERSASAVAVADPEGRGELVEFRSGVGWVVDRVVELCQRWEAAVRLDAYSPAGSLADELVARGVRVERYSTREVSYACGSFFDRLMDGKVEVRRHAALDEAAAGARRRSTGDSWVWARRDAECDVAPLIALTLALDVRAASEPELWVDFG